MHPDPKHTAEQLRLAATILETGHPWEVHLTRGWRRMEQESPSWSIANDCKIRLALATPPDGRVVHNPDDLTAEQVGAGFRLTLPGEEPCEGVEMYLTVANKWGKWLSAANTPYNKYVTYRLPLSVPWPEAKPDPYAELKAAHAEGKVIEYRDAGSQWLWRECKDPGWYPSTEYRVKPEEPFQLPPPPPGMQWHRTDGWKEGDLPQGYRPLAMREKIQAGDEWKTLCEGEWRTTIATEHCVGNEPLTPQARRTTRPLTFEHVGKTWTYHRPGDPMPCDGEARIHVLIRDDLADDPPVEAKAVEWDWAGAGDIIGWRYAEPATKTVPLGPEDVPPGSVFRMQHFNPGIWVLPCAISSGGVYYSNPDLESEEIDWSSLFHKWQINRSVPLTGKWNPEAWEPCHKTINL